VFDKLLVEAGIKLLLFRSWGGLRVDTDPGAVLGLL
jgi:hypothetical protein